MHLLPCSSLVPNMIRTRLFSLIPESNTAFAAKRPIMTGPLLSSTPRPQIMSSFSSPPQGSTVHPFPSGTTSRWPRTATISSPSPISAQPAALSTFFVLKPIFSANARVQSRHFLGPSPYGAPSAGSPPTLGMRTTCCIAAVRSSFIASSVFSSKTIPP